MRGLIPASAVVLSVFPGFETLAKAELTDNGGGLIYDSNTNLTWCQGSGGVNWDQAYSWAQSLNAGGVAGWRLPAYPQTSGYTFDPSGPTDEGELGQLWAASLGNTPGSNYANAGPFDPTSWFAGGYWTADVYGNHLATLAALYNMGNGTVGAGTLNAGGFAFAVHEGNVGAPEPATISLVVLGLMGLARVRRKCGK
jgi:hypothetical protein